MSGQATGWVLKNGPRDRVMRAVLVAIADDADRLGDHARPGLETISEAALYSPTHCKRAIARLLHEGWLEQIGRPGPGSVAEYRIVAMNGDHSDTRSDQRGPQDGPSSNGNADQTGTKMVSERGPNGDPLGGPSSEGLTVLSKNVTTSARARRGSRRLPESPFPEGQFVITSPMKEWARANGFGAVDLRFETAQFKDHALSHDRRCRDWVAAWRNWIRKAAERGLNRNGSSPHIEKIEPLRLTAQ